MNNDRTPLTDFQVEVARAFFAMPASAGFLLAGGAALAAQRLTTRPTHDLDFFTAPGDGDVAHAHAAFLSTARARGWSVETIQQSPTFARMHITGPNELLVDLAVDSRPGHAPTVGIAGPTYAPEELAGRKLIALFDRAAARDFADVYQLTEHFTKAQLLRYAAEVDAGFDTAVLSEMIDNLRRYRDNDIPIHTDQVAALRNFFQDWSAELRE